VLAQNLGGAILEKLSSEIAESFYAAQRVALHPDRRSASPRAGETAEHWTDGLLHETLLKLDPADTAPAEDALLTAIAVAQRQKARSFELRGALGMARLYNSTGRPADAHTLLASALEGFSPTAEFPERQADFSGIAMAKLFCRTADWLDPPRVR
jgi:predicted ATPase